MKAREVFKKGLCQEGCRGRIEEGNSWRPGRIRKNQLHTVQSPPSLGLIPILCMEVLTHPAIHRVPRVPQHRVTGLGEGLLFNGLQESSSWEASPSLGMKPILFKSRQQNLPCDKTIFYYGKATMSHIVTRYRKKSDSNQDQKYQLCVLQVHSRI